MEIDEKTPKSYAQQEFVFKLPAAPRKLKIRKTECPSTNPPAHSSANAGCSASPCVQLGQKRETFLFSPTVRTPTNSPTNRFFCEDDWSAWQDGMTKSAVHTFIGPRPPTPPTWIATPHRSALHHRLLNVDRIQFRRRLATVSMGDEAKIGGKLGQPVKPMTAIQNLDGMNPTSRGTTQWILAEFLHLIAHWSSIIHRHNNVLRVLCNAFPLQNERICHWDLCLLSNFFVYSMLSWLEEFFEILC